MKSPRLNIRITVWQFGQINLSDHVLIGYELSLFKLILGFWSFFGIIWYCYFKGPHPAKYDSKKSKLVTTLISSSLYCKCKFSFRLPLLNIIISNSSKFIFRFHVMQKYVSNRHVVAILKGILLTVQCYLHINSK